MFKIPIANEDDIIAQSKSQAGQDLFVVGILQGKRNGTFLEIGSGHPIDISNTWLLELFFNFTGDSIDNANSGIVYPDKYHFKIFYNNVKSDSWPDVDSFDDLPLWIQEECKNLHKYTTDPYVFDLPRLWTEFRPNTNFHNFDALHFDYDNLNSHYDYLQIDIDLPKGSLNLLEKLIPKHEFSVITFEHDVWQMTNEVKFVREKSREFLSAHNYTLLVDDVTIQPGKGKGINNNPIFFEDWYVNKKFINQDIIDAYKFVAPDVIKYYPDILFRHDHLAHSNST
jgi:hypothetical protein